MDASPHAPDSPTGLVPPTEWYGDSYELAAERLRLTLPLLARHRLPANPVNFAVFYGYAAGQGGGLVEDIDRTLAAGEPITGEMTQQLFLRYVLPWDAGLLEQLRRDLHRLVDEALHCVTTVGADASRSREALAGHVRRMECETAPPSLAQLVTAIVEETRAIARAEEGLVEHLGATAGEIQGLRAELERVRQEASTDTLTGIPNRRAFDAALREAAQAARDGAGELCLALVDIDHFKRVNDAHGHLVGDRVLRLIAAQLKASMKGRDFVARYGGEEFAIVLPETPARGALAAAEGVRSTIERSRMKRADTGEPIGTITVSIGVARYRQGEAQDDFTRRCDEALYAAKREGRNRVALAADTRVTRQPEDHHVSHP